MSITPEISDRADDPEVGVIVRESRTKAAVRAGGALAFVVVGAWGASEFSSRWVALVGGAAFFALAAARYVWTLIRPGYLRISVLGIELDQGWKHQFWRWTDVGEVSVTVGRTRFASTTMIGLNNDRPPVRLWNWDLPPLELKRLLDGYRPAMQHRSS
jgi:hypothetical protein